MRQLAILSFVFVAGICLANVSWGQGCRHGGYYRPGTSISIGYGNFGYYNNVGYGYNTNYYPGGYGYGYGYGGGYPVHYHRAYSVPAVPYYRPGCGYGGSGGGIYFRW